VAWFSNVLAEGNMQTGTNITPYDFSFLNAV